MREREREKGKRGQGVRALLPGLAAAIGLALGAPAGCAPRRPPEPAPGALASASSAPKQLPTLSVQTYYSPAMRLGLRLDGEPFTGKAWLLPTLSDAFDLPPDSDDVPPIDDAVELDAKGGEASIDDEALRKLSRNEAFHLFVKGHRYPYARGGLVHPFRCAQAIAALRAEAVCTEPLPTAETPPPTCDDGGQRGWRTALEEQNDKIPACWTALDEPTIAAVVKLQDPGLRAIACGRMLALAGPSPEVALGVRLFDPCRTSFEPAYREQVTLAKRRADLPAAFERAKGSSSTDMQAFYMMYRVTGDPRVEEIRKLAAARFGPKNLAAFVATDKALRALNGPSAGYWLCDARDGVAQVVTSEGGSAPPMVDFLGEAEPPGEEGGRRSCRVVYRSRRRPPPRPVGPSTWEPGVVNLVKARLGVKAVTLTSYCGANHWYLHPAAPPSTSPGY